MPNCQDCGKYFETEHGLITHRGMIHSFVMTGKFKDDDNLISVIFGERTSYITLF